MPLSGSIEDYGVHVIPYLMNGFVYDDDRNYLNMTNGKVESAAIKPEWKQGLAYIKSLYDEKLFNPGAFTQMRTPSKKSAKTLTRKYLAQAPLCIPLSSLISTTATNTRPITMCAAADRP